MISKFTHRLKVLRFTMWTVILVELSCATGLVFAQPKSKPQPIQSKSQLDDGGGKTVHHEQGDANKQAEAKARFLQGLKLAKDGNCQGAIAEFKASLRRVERPNTLYNIAQCFEELFQYDQAIAYYERYLQIAPKDAPDRRTVESTTRLLNNLLGTVETKTNVKAEVWIDDRVVGTSPGRFKVPGGTHLIEFRQEGYLTVKKQITVTAKANLKIQAKLEQAQKRIEITQVKETKLPSAYFWTGTALTLSAATVGAVMGAKALSLRAETKKRPLLDRQGRQSRIDEMNQFSLTADIMFGVSGGFALGSIILYFFTDWGDSEASEDAPEEVQKSKNQDEEAVTKSQIESKFSIRVSPYGGSQSAGIELSGAF